jgi:hypothetical protein
MAIVRESRGAVSDDRSTSSELDLYVALYKCVVHQTVQFDQTNSHFQQWKVAHDERSYLHDLSHQKDISPADTFTVLEQDTTLKLGYNSAVLILERWELAQKPIPAPSATTPEDAVLAGIAIRFVVSRAIAVLEALGTLTATAHGTTPMYDILLGTYAGVTLVQFADMLIDPGEAAGLMRMVDQQRKSRMRSREPVLTWATNMMEKKALDLEAVGPRRPAAHFDCEWLESEDRASFEWVPLIVRDGIDTDAATGD